MERRLRLLRLAGVGALVSLFALLPIAIAAAAPRTAETKNVGIRDNVFEPKMITVNVGDTVVWKNGGQHEHTVTADDGSFNSDDLAPGKEFSHTFTKAGTFAYYCKYHGGPHGVGMSGTVVVQAASKLTQLTTQKPKLLPRTGVDAPDMSGFAVLAAILTLVGGLVLRRMSMRTRV
jgi:plastocyanin